MNAVSSSEKSRILSVFEETLHGSNLPQILGARPFRLADCAVGPEGLLWIDHGHAQLVLRVDRDLRRIEGASSTRLVRVTGSFTRDRSGQWYERESLVVEYATLASLKRNGMPERHLSSQRRPDGSTVAFRIERAPIRDAREELLRRTTCLTQADASRVEEDETLHRIDQSARYELLRREYDAHQGRERSLEYRYPWRPERAYAAMRDAWIAAARSVGTCLLPAA